MLVQSHPTFTALPLACRTEGPVAKFFYQKVMHPTRAFHLQCQSDLQALSGCVFFQEFNPWRQAFKVLLVPSTFAPLYVMVRTIASEMNDSNVLGNRSRRQMVFSTLVNKDGKAAHCDCVLKDSDVRTPDHASYITISPIIWMF